MTIYLDDNFTDRALAGALRKASHIVHRPVDFGLSGASDARHLERAVRDGLTILTKDRDDFLELHQLLQTAHGTHHGVIVVQFDNDAKRDMKSGHIVVALRKLEASGMPLVNEWIVLNQWR